MQRPWLTCPSRWAYLSLARGHLQALGLPVVNRDDDSDWDCPASRPKHRSHRAEVVGPRQPAIVATPNCYVDAGDTERLLIPIISSVPKHAE